MADSNGRSKKHPRRKQQPTSLLLPRKHVIKSPDTGLNVEALNIPQVGMQLHNYSSYNVLPKLFPLLSKTVYQKILFTSTDKTLLSQFKCPT